MSLFTDTKIKRLKIYLEKCRRDAAAPNQTPQKVAFFQREIAKTESTIQKLT